MAGFQIGFFRFCFTRWIQRSLCRGLREDVLAAELALIYANTVKTLILPAVLFQRPVGKDLIPFSPLSGQGALAYLQFTE